MATNSRVQRLLPYLENQNVKKFLDLLAAAEGTTKHGYATGFGGNQLPSLDDHPRELKAFTQTDGKKNKTSAAGRYQFLSKTWDDLADKLSLKDFGQGSQDLAALELIRRAGALDDVANGDFESAVKKTGATWASLPSSPHPQGKRSWEFVYKFLDTPEPPKTIPLAFKTATPPGIAQSTRNLLKAYTSALETPVASQSFKSLMPGVFEPPPELPTIFNPVVPATGEVAIYPGGQPADAETWENALLAGAIKRDADTARNNAVSAMLGQKPVSDIELPSQFHKLINRIVSAF